MRPTPESAYTCSTSVRNALRDAEDECSTKKSNKVAAQYIQVALLIAPRDEHRRIKGPRKYGALNTQILIGQLFQPIICLEKRISTEPNSKCWNGIDWPQLIKD
jgi:hypothetical protein